MQVLPGCQLACGIGASQATVKSALPQAQPLNAAPPPCCRRRLQGEQFEIIGTLATWAIPILAVLGVGIGLFASATYDEVRPGLVGRARRQGRQPAAAAPTPQGERPVLW